MYWLLTHNHGKQKYTLVISFIYYRETKRLERPPLPGPVKGIWLVLYALSSTFCLVTLSLWIVTLILPRFPKPPPSDTYVWFLTINLNVVGLVIMTLETVLSRVPLDKAQGSVWTMVFALLYIGWVFLANSNALNFSYVPSPFEIIGGTYTAVAWTSFVVVGAGAFALSLAVHALRGNLRANAKVLR